MERFANAQVGDLVYCRKNGEGKIISTKAGKSYPIMIRFEKDIKEGAEEIYTTNGHYEANDIEPILFYRKGEERYLTERPEPEHEPEID